MKEGLWKCQRQKRVENISKYKVMEDTAIKLPDVEEPTVTFKLVSDRTVYNIINADIKEALVEISGYDLDIKFNMQYLKSVEDIDAACKGISDLFKELIMEKLLEYRKQ